MRPPTLALMSIALSFLVVPTELTPCSCVKHGSGAAALETYDAVFEGSVVAVQRLLIPSHSSSSSLTQSQIALVRVVRTWKGSLPPIATVYTGSGGGDCGYLFIEGEHYVVFANALRSQQRKALNESKLALYTDICEFTTPLGNAPELVKDLSERRHPVSAAWLPY